MFCRFILRRERTPSLEMTFHMKFSFSVMGSPNFKSSTRWVIRWFILRLDLILYRTMPSSWRTGTKMFGPLNGVERSKLKFIYIHTVIMHTLLQWNQDVRSLLSDAGFTLDEWATPFFLTSSVESWCWIDYLWWLSVHLGFLRDM